MSESKKDVETIRPAATVMLIRPNGGGFQVYLLKRNVRSAFMPGYYVFPGGTVAAEDRRVDKWQAHVDLGSKDMRRRLGGDLRAEEVLPYGVAAIRETLEEAGVLLARRRGSQENDRAHFSEKVLQRDRPADWFRRQIESGEWTLLFSRLFRWARWITPEGMQRRFDTRFFVAFLPPDQICRPDQQETTHGIWADPEEGLAGNMAAKVPLSPPTLITLYELKRFKDYQQLVDEVKTRPWGEARRPRLIRVNGESIILQPWDRQHGQEKVDIDTRRLAASILPLGEPCSRIWCQNGIWRSVGA